MLVTSCDSPWIPISCTNIFYVIKLFHFPVVIQLYQLAFAIFGIYQLLTLRLKPYHSYPSHSLWPLPWANDFDLASMISIASTSIIKVLRAWSFKLDPWVLSSNPNIGPLLTWFDAPKFHPKDSHLVDSSSKLSNYYQNSARIF